MNITDEEGAHIKNFSKVLYGRKLILYLLKLRVSFLQTTMTQIANFKTCMDKV